jgi:hypothetical protein
MTTPAKRRIRQLNEQIKASFTTQAKISEAAAAGLIDLGYAQAKIIVLSNHRSDLTDEVEAIGLGSEVTSAPSDTEIAMLAAAIVTLHQRNVTRAAIQDIIADGFALADLALN